MNIRYPISLAMFWCMFITYVGHGQEIQLYNPSWEGYPHAGGDSDDIGIIGWKDCGAPGETPPDLHAGRVFPNQFDVRQKPSQGRTYLGLVVRENDTWEAVSQVLLQPLIRGRCYSFNIDLCRSNIYNSGIEKDGKREDRSFTTPTVLRIYGANSSCGRTELLAESDRVTNVDWKNYSFEFKPKSTYRYIKFEAFYKTPVLDPYNGNLLLDNASTISLIDCDNGKLIAAVEPSEIKVDKPKANKPLPKVTEPKVKESNPVKDDSTISAPDNLSNDPVVKEELALIPDLKKPVKVNQVIKIDKLYFDEDRASIKDVSYVALDEIYYFLLENRDVGVEVSGHTNGLCADDYCNKLSRKRARAVWLYLVQKGIPAKQIKYKGYGKKDPVADDNTAHGRQQNQRVEIKILSVDN